MRDLAARQQRLLELDREIDTTALMSDADKVLGSPRRGIASPKVRALLCVPVR